MAFATTLLTIDEATMVHAAMVCPILFEMMEAIGPFDGKIVTRVLP